MAGAANTFLPQGAVASLTPDQQLPATKPVMALVTAAMLLVIYDGLGLLGLKLTRTIGWADIWDDQVSNRQRFLLPAVTGALIGIFFILVDAWLASWHGLGALPHPPFPTSLVASLVAANYYFYKGRRVAKRTGNDVSFLHADHDRMEAKPPFYLANWPRPIRHRQTNTTGNETSGRRNGGAVSFSTYYPYGAMRGGSEVATDYHYTAALSLSASGRVRRIALRLLCCLW